MKLAICICTYKRPKLLRRLMDDLAIQTTLPDCLIIVDGDPNSSMVRDELRAVCFENGAKCIYVPSNFPNQPYQRYLGWRIAKEENANILLYFDDDIKLIELDVVAQIIKPFSWPDRNVVGVTANTITPDVGTKLAAAPAVLEQHRKSDPSIVRWLGSSRSISPGGITPTGHRVTPLSEGDYVNVAALSGRVMATKMALLEESMFTDDIFALKDLKIGLGEDTLLSHNLLSAGELLLARKPLIEHPDDDLPNSYPHRANSYGYAVAYSRRLINDYYRFPGKPFLSDRLALIKSYFGNILLNWMRFFTGPRKYRFQFASGYTLGAIKGLIYPPRAKNLTPQIDWRPSAELALDRKETIVDG